MKIAFLENEYWWGGIAHDGRMMPIGAQDCYSAELSERTAGNQSVPFFLSSRGRYIWSEEPFSVTFNNGEIEITDGDAQIYESGGNTLKDAYNAACIKHFPFGGEVPQKEFFGLPQYNTWAELTYGQNQQSVLAYAHAVIDNGYSAGIITLTMR